jgi:hypothetical protein
MFKTASFRLHDPSQHKQAMIRYAMTTYHRTLSALLQVCLNDEGLFDRCKTTLKSGAERRSPASALRRKLAGC